MVFSNLLLTSSIAIATLFSNATSNNLEATSSEINGALNQIVLTNVGNFSCDDFEDAIKISYINILMVMIMHLIELLMNSKIFWIIGSIHL